jgi:hypothetical protein
MCGYGYYLANSMYTSLQKNGGGQAQFPVCPLRYLPATEGERLLKPSIYN